MAEKAYYVTEEGLAALQAELEDLKVNRRKEVAENIKEALSFGDLSENSEYDEAKNDQAILEARIADLEVMVSKRVMGKASFCNVQDLKGGIQCYVARDAVGEDSYKDFKKFDIGDIIGVRGEVFKTKTGEISIHASAVTLLSKSLQVLPEKFHGLTNTDMR